MGVMGITGLCKLTSVQQKDVNVLRRANGVMSDHFMEVSVKVGGEFTKRGYATCEGNSKSEHGWQSGLYNEKRLNEE